MAALGFNQKGVVPTHLEEAHVVPRGMSANREQLSLASLNARRTAEKTKLVQCAAFRYWYRRGLNSFPATPSFRLRTSGCGRIVPRWPKAKRRAMQAEKASGSFGLLLLENVGSSIGFRFTGFKLWLHQNSMQTLLQTNALTRPPGCKHNSTAR